MDNGFDIVEVFEITGRGAVVVIDEVTERIPGVAYDAHILSNTSKLLDTVAYKEWFLKRHPKPIEKEAYMLKGLLKHNIPEKTKIVFL